MKLYIRCAIENHDVFKMTTGTSYYDNFLNTEDLDYMRKSKNRDGKIVMMTPDEYFEHASEIFKYHSSPNDLVDQRSDKYTDQYVEDMKRGDKFPLCYLNYADSGQEGLHRMLAAKRAFGPNVKYPVLVVTVYDQGIEDRNKIWKEIYSFEHHEFRDIVDYLESHISNKYHFPPENLIEISEQFIEGELNYYTDGHDRPYDITFECNVIEYPDSEKRLGVYLTGFNGYDIKDPDMMPNSPWFDNMFDYDESAKSFEDSYDYNLNDISDKELEELLKDDPALYGLLFSD